MAKDDLASLLRAFKKVPRAVRRAVEPALDKGADDLVRTAKSLAPVDDGDLQASIRKEPGRHSLERIVAAGGEATTRPVRSGVNATFDYALAVEYGTREQPAQPYFWPAYALRKKSIKRRTDRAISKAIKQEWAK